MGDARAETSRGHMEPPPDQSAELGKPGHADAAPEATTGGVDEDRLRASEQHLAALINQTVAGIAETDLVGRFTLVNDRYCQITGYTRDELLAGMRMQEITHPDDLPRNLEQFRQLTAEGAAFGVEKRYVRKDGALVWVSNSVSLIRDADGAPRSVVAVEADVTERKRHEAELQASATCLRALAVATASAIWRVDAAGEVLDGAIDRWPFLTDRPPEELAAEWLAAVHPDDREPGNAVWWQGVAAGEPFEFTQRVRQHDGSYRHFLVRAVPVRGEDGAIREWVGAEVDITERRVAEAALRERDEFLRLTLQAARAGAWASDLGLTQEDWSEEVFSLFGLDPEDVAPSFARVLAAVHPDDRDWLEAKSRADVAAGREGQSEFRVVWPDGSVHWIFARGRTIADAAGQPRRVGLFLDITERKQAEEALRASQQQLQQMADAMPQVVWIAGADGTVRYYNNRVAAFAGVVRSGHRTWDWRPIVHPDDLESTLAAWNRAVQERAPYAHEHRIKTVGGGYRWHLSRAVPVVDERGGIETWYGTATDIHDLKEAEIALRENEERLRLGIEIAGFALFEIDHETDKVHLSAAAARLYGMGEEAVTISRDRIHAAFHPDDREEMRRRIAASLEAADVDSFTSEYRVLWPNGEVRWMNVRKRVFFDRRGPRPRPVRTMLAVLDVTERKRAEVEIRRSEERFRSLVSVITDVPWTAAADGAFETTQPAWAAYTGQTWEEMRGFGWLDALHPDDREAVRQSGTTAVARQAAYESSGRLWHAPTQQYRYYVSRATPMYNPDGTIREWVGTCTDVHERMQAEADRQRLLDALAHDLRNPLTTMKMQTQLLRRQIERRGVPETDALAERIAGFETLADRMTMLLDELDDLAQLTTGDGVMPRRHPVDLVALLRDSVEETRQSNARHAILLETGDEELAGEFDEAQLRRVIANLLDNAVKYSPDGGEVRVRLRRDGLRAILEVQDEGIGIPAFDLPHVFTFRHRGGNVGAITGSGVGLAGVKQIVEGHGGSVAVKSEEGRGSVFTVRLPLRRREAERADGRSP